MLLGEYGDGLCWRAKGGQLETREQSTIAWTAYLRYRAKLRGFELEKIEEILRYSSERYFDTVTRCSIVVGKHNDSLVIIPYEQQGNEMTPITIHATTRQQINFRLKAGRFVHE
jgi:hypothetical protein